MPLTINTNMAASRASYFLSKNNDALQKSLDRLSSGKRITQPSDDAGGLAVSMKLQGEINTLKGAANNVSNAISFLQVQDGILDSAGQIVTRISELYGMSQDILNSATPAIFDSEIQDLIGQLDGLTSSEFNGVALFDVAAGKDVVATSTINISQSDLSTELVSGTVDLADNSETTALIKAEIDAAAGNDPLGDILSAIATLRATNGGEAKRLQFEQQNIATQISNLEAANGRIMDVDIASETTNLAKQQILVQASASMVAQANSANQVALMLLQ